MEVGQKDSPEETGPARLPGAWRRERRNAAQHFREWIRFSRCKPVR